jgi:effector-binding domain-containing protein
MSFAFDSKEQPRLDVASVRTRSAVQDLPEVLTREYGRVMQALGKQGLNPSGPPFVVYYNMDMQDLDIEAGLAVAGDFANDGDVLRSEIPAGRVATCLYTGPYDHIREAYDVLMAWMKDQGLRESGPAYEFYLNDPGNTPAEQLQTDVRIPIEG